MVSPVRRRRRTLWYALGAFVALNLVVAAVKPSDSVLPRNAGADVVSGRDANLENVAAALVGSTPDVWCWSREDWHEKTAKLTREYHARAHSGRSPYGPWSAFATPNGIHLSPEVCGELRRLVQETGTVTDSKWPDALAWAVAAFAHEAYHVVGVMDEAVAECYGTQSIAETARLLGRSDADGRELTLRYLERWRPRLPPSYRSNQCRSDGPLDLEPDRSSWP